MLAIEKINSTVIAIENSKVKTAVDDITFAVQTANTAYGIIQYNAYVINQQFKDMPKGAQIGGFYKYEDFCKSVFGLERSQSFSLAKAGRLIRKVKTSETTFGYIDCFTLEAAGLTNAYLKNEIIDISELKPFSFTALIVIAEKYGKLTVAEITAKLHDYGIGSNMTVAEIKSIINPAKLTIKKKSSQSDNGTDNGTDNSKEKPITITLTESQALALKVQLVQFTEKTPKGAKVDKIVEFINKMNEQLK